MSEDRQADLLARIVSSNNATLLTQIEELRSQLNALTNVNTVTEYVTQTIDDNIPCSESLEVIKSLPEFSGKQTSYVSWREAANNSMSLYLKGSKRYFAALTVLRNKVVSEANDVLTNHGTVLNFDAIISRLDFAYADKRPVHIIEQEMSVLRQGSYSLIDYYNMVNEKLTLLINKTIMTHGSNSDITKELNSSHRRNALRIFITGLHQPLANILFSLNPDDLPSALAKAQELESNNMRTQFANQYNKHYNTPKFHEQNQLRFPQRNNNKFQKHVNPEPMDVDTSMQHSFKNNRGINYFSKPQPYNPQNNNRNLQPRYNNNYQAPQQPIQKRSYEHNSSNNQPQPKYQRVNNICETAFLDERQDCPTYSGYVNQETQN